MTNGTNGLTALTPADRRRRGELERVVRDGLATVLEVGAALCEIREQQLWRETHATFEKYLHEVFDLPKRRAYQIIEAAEVRQDLCKILHSHDPDCPIPQTESHCHELSKLDDETAAEVWTRVIEETENKPTASAIRRVASELVVDAAVEPPAEPVAPQKQSQGQEAADRGAEVGGEIKKSIASAIRLVKAITEGPGTEALSASAKSIVRHLENAKVSVTAATPAAVCPRCKGRRCPQCGNYGWVSSVTLRELEK